MFLITPDTGLLFWMVIIFGLVFFLLAKYGFPVITGMVEKRNDHIDKSLRLAREAEEQMAGLKAEQERIIEETRLEQARMIQEATNTRNVILEQAREDASREASLLLEKAKKEIAVEKETALREVRTEIATLSVEMAEKVLRKELSDSATQDALATVLAGEMAREQQIDNGPES